MIPAALVMPFDLIDKHTWLISGAPQSSEIVEMEPPMLINQRFMNLGSKVLASCLINNFQLWIHHRRIPCRRPLAKSDPHRAASNHQEVAQLPATQPSPSVACCGGRFWCSFPTLAHGILWKKNDAYCSWTKSCTSWNV